MVPETKRAIQRRSRKLSVLQKAPVLPILSKPPSTDLQPPPPHFQSPLKVPEMLEHDSIMWLNYVFSFFFIAANFKARFETGAYRGWNYFKHWHIKAHCHNQLPGPPVPREDDMPYLTSKAPIRTGIPFLFRLLKWVGLFEFELIKRLSFTINEFVFKDFNSSLTHFIIFYHPCSILDL